MVTALRALWVASVVLTFNATHATAFQERPYRGSVGISVLLCKYRDAPEPSRTRGFYEDLLVNVGRRTLADYWRDVSHGSITTDGSVVMGWYTLDQSEAEARAYGGGGSSDRINKHTDCVDKARADGFTAPSDHVVVVITSPGIDSFGFEGGAFLTEDTSVGVVAHEVGHGLSLAHSYSDHPEYCNAPWAAFGEYDDQWDAMSYANVFTTDLGVYGQAAPWLNAYHQDRMGWLDRRKIFRFGADGVYDRQVTLTAVSRPSDSGYVMVRIPFDPNDLYRYYTVEYRVPESWDGGFPADVVLIHEVKAVPRFRCSDRSNRGVAYHSYLVKEPGRPGDFRPPMESIDLNGVRVDVVSKDSTTGKAVVRLRSTRPDHCLQGLVWREARSTDHVCVTQVRRGQVAAENRQASSRRQPGGGDICREGFVWREAFPGDRVCVPRASRSAAQAENEGAAEKRVGGAAYGPNTCRPGFVWREADPKDWVCVTQARRDEVQEENRQARSRRQPAGGGHGPDTCREGFVWRDAFPGDHVCVTRESRSKAHQDNEQASDRLARKGA